MRIIQGSERLITDKWHAPTGKVAVDWSRAPRGLMAFMLNNTSSFQEVTNSYQTTFYTGGTSTPCQMGMSSIAPCFDPTKGTNPSAYITPNTSYYTHNSFEVLIYFLVATTNRGYTRISDGTPDNGTWDRMIGKTQNDHATFYVFDGTTNLVEGSITLLLNKFYHLVGVADGSSISIYVNGILDGSQAATNAGYTGFTTPIFSQGYGSYRGTLGNANGTPQDTILHAAIYNVALTADEVMQRYLNMYDFLMPAEGEWPALFVSAAPPPPAQGNTLPLMGVA